MSRRLILAARPVPPIDLITRDEYGVLFVLLDTALDGGIYRDDPDIERDMRRLREKLRRRGKVR